MAGQLKIAGAVADGSITESKLADDAVTADKLANSINTAIAANTAKDLTALSASNLTSGTVPDARFPATLPAASAANLTSIPAANLTGALPAISGASLTGISSDFVKISSTTMSGEASEFDLTFDNSTYSQFKLYICGLNLSYDANLYVRFRVGTTFITASNYYGGTIKKYSGGFDSSTYGGQHQSYGYLTDNVGGNDGTYERWSGIIDILCGNSGGMPFLRHDSFYKDAASTHANTMGIVGYQNWSILSGIRVYASSGNINHGKFELYGIK